MAKYECIGFRRKEGMSSKTGKPYSFTVVYAIDHTDYSSSGLVGHQVKEILIPNLVLDGNPKQLSLGCRFKLLFNERAYVEDIVFE